MGLQMHRSHRVAGALVGAAVGSALEALIAGDLALPGQLCPALDGEDVELDGHDVTEVMRRVIDTCGDAAGAGAPAGAVFGMAGIPMRWSSVVHGEAAGRSWRLDDLQELAAALDGARYSDSTFAVISLCRLGEPFGHETQRMAYIADNDYNTELDVASRTCSPTGRRCARRDDGSSCTATAARRGRG